MRSRFLRHMGAISQVSVGPVAAHLAHAATLAAKGAPTEELPAEFSWHDYAIFLLSTAAEIEHSLMVQYLYAAYSALEPLSKKSLAKYIVAESPEDWPDSVKHERGEIESLARDAAMQPVVPVHELYDKMIDTLSDRKHIPDALFRAETYPLQASWDDWGRGYAKGARGAVADTRLTL
jgi:hypothetical protein